MTLLSFARRLALLTVPAMAATALAAPPAYTITQVPIPLGAYTSEMIRSLNASGELVSTWAPQQQRKAEKPFRWSAASGFTLMENLPKRPRNTAAYALNDAGVAVGTDGFGGGLPGFERAVMFVPGETTRDLHALMPAGTRASTAADINNRGQVIGWLALGGRSHGYVWSEAEGIRLIDQGFPAFINDAGTIVVRGYGNPWFYGTLEAGFYAIPGSEYVGGLNDAGQMVGTNEEGDALLWDPDPQATPVPLPRLPGAEPCFPRGINNHGMIVGNCAPYAVMWAPQDGGYVVHNLRDLTNHHDRWLPGTNDRGTYREEMATAINDAGQIVVALLRSPPDGDSWRPDHDAVILTPR